MFVKESGRISEDQLIGGTWTPSFYGYDGHGSTRFLTNMAGAVTDTYNYDAFGNVISSTGSTPNEFLFAGEQFDPALGFYYMRARYYRPATGRFWTPDPIEGKLCCGMSWNAYLYAKDDPVGRLDPRGKDDVLLSYASLSEAAIPEARLISIYGCVSSIALTGTSLVLKNNLDYNDLIGAAGTTFGCVSLYFPEASAGRLAGPLLKLVPAVNYGFCGASLEALVDDLNQLVHESGTGGGTFADAIGALSGCVTTRLSTLVAQEGEGL